MGFNLKRGEPTWHIATIDNGWVFLLGFSALALKLKVRDE